MRARWVLVMAVLLPIAPLARAQPAAPPAKQTGPIRVDVNCEGDERTKACPAFIAGFIDANKVLLSAPRAAADVSLYVTATDVAQTDRLHLRFVSHMPDTPPLVELDVDLDSRADDDTQRAQLEPAFLRGVALFVAARFPQSVVVSFGPPTSAGSAAAPDTSPWDVGLAVAGVGNHTAQYKSANGTAALSVSELDKHQRISATLGATGGLNRQPPLMLADGTIVSTNTDLWSLTASTTGAWLYDDHWSFGGHVGWYRDDPNGQYRYTTNAKAGVEWDGFKADDPRGNRLAILYYAGYQADGYNLRDDLGETSASYPIHALIADGSVREDKASLGLELVVAGEVIHPGRRHQITASPYIDVKLGGHVDLSVSFTITKRELPAPDPAAIDPTDYAEISRLSYAEPLSLIGALSLSIHTDRTNGERNDRFTDLN